jgi:hypothetical protein
VFIEPKHLATTAGVENTLAILIHSSS